MLTGLRGATCRNENNDKKTNSKHRSDDTPQATRVYAHCGITFSRGPCIPLGRTKAEANPELKIRKF